MKTIPDHCNVGEEGHCLASGIKTWTTASSNIVAAQVHVEVPEHDSGSRKGKRSMAVDAKDRASSTPHTTASSS
jgi:hypothetical protein